MVKKITSTCKKTRNTDILCVEGNIKGKDILLIGVYLRVINGNPEKEINQNTMKEIIEIIDNNQEKPILIAGDFNGHLGYIGELRLNYNGKLANSMIEENGLILLNIDEKCNGTYTWSRNEQKSVIDFAIGNEKLYRMSQKMEIDEKQEKFDLTDHNLIEIQTKVTQENDNFSKKSDILETKYYSTKKKT